MGKAETAALPVGAEDLNESGILKSAKKSTGDSRCEHVTLARISRAAGHSFTSLHKGHY